MRVEETARADRDESLTPVSTVEMVEESGGPSTELVPRGDRHPPNLFLLSSPGLVLFPELTVPVPLHEAWAERTLVQARSQSEFVGVVVQTTPLDGDVPPDPESLSRCGCLARVVRTLEMPDGRRTVLLQGVRRFRVDRFLRQNPYLIAKVEYPEEEPARGDEAEALVRNIRQLLRELLARGTGAPEELSIAVLNIERKGALADVAAAYFLKDLALRTTLLGEHRVERRLVLVHEELLKERHLMDLGQRLEQEIVKQIEERQREFFLREQLKTIRRELGEEVDERTLEAQGFRERMQDRALPEDVQGRVEAELERLIRIPLESPEAGVLRNWLDTVLGVPWGVEREVSRELDEARAILDGDHAGLEPVKDRILEFLAVRRRRTTHKGQILCFVGPPGVGKTSLGRSIAKALGREFCRLSLGGIHDEAEIRGHRRTYVGAMPGRLVRALQAAGTMNPVMVLDELDKVGQDFRGDPSAALLEVLDPEQNHAFSDHYLELPVDLSRVFFLATANQLDTIPPALRDRLEVLTMEGYAAEEKTVIARRHLVPRQLAAHGLRRRDLPLSVAVVRAIIDQYTREPGVRGLDQNLARLCRKAVWRLESGEEPPIRVSPPDLPELLGPPPFPRERSRRPARPGIATGLAWTPVGGTVLEIQAAWVPGAGGEPQVTGRLGEVMQESARIALSYVESHAGELGLAAPRSGPGRLHLHAPAGATPKDGPSAGVTLATALVSLRRGQPVRPRLAMTGELTLTGQVLAVGGVRDKILAARRHGLREVVLPAANRADVEEIPPELVKGLTFHFVEDYLEILPLAFRGRPPAARTGA